MILFLNVYVESGGQTHISTYTFYESKKSVDSVSPLKGFGRYVITSYSIHYTKLYEYAMDILHWLRAMAPLLTKINKKFRIIFCTM